MLKCDVVEAAPIPTPIHRIVVLVAIAARLDWCAWQANAKLVRTVLYGLKKVALLVEIPRILLPKINRATPISQELLSNGLYLALSP